MNPFDEAEFKVQTANMYADGGIVNVLNCFIAMLESQLIITNAIKEILIKERK